MANREIIFDIGSHNISAAYAEDKFFNKIPALVAIGGADGKQIVAVGNKAELAHKNGAKLSAPILEGTIIDADGAKALFKMLLERVLPSGNTVFSNYVAKCIVPCGTISSDKKNIESALLSLGARQVSFVEAPIVDSVELFRQFRTHLGLIMDIGSDCADIAVVNEGAIVSGCTLFHAGKHLTQMISERVLAKYMIQLSNKEAEELKENCASLFSNNSATYSVIGQNVKSSMTETIAVSSKELYDTVVEYAKMYVSVLNSLMTSLPADMQQRLRFDGVMLCGGGAKLSGLEAYLSEQLGIPVRLAESPEDVTINGAINYTK